MANGSAFAPLSQEWRYDSGYEHAHDYAQLLADEVERAAYRLTAFHAARPGAGDPSDLVEAVAVELTGAALTRYDSSAALSETVTGLLGFGLSARR